MTDLKRRDLLAAGAGGAALLALAGPAPARAAPGGVVQVKGLAIGEGRPKIIVSLAGKTPEAVLEQAHALAGRPEIDIVELRIDHLAEALDPAASAALAAPVAASIGGKPLLATFRTKREGGETAIEPTRYAALYQALLDTKAVDLIDLELALLEAPAVATVQRRAQGAGVAVLLSHHDFGGTPPTERMLALLEEQAARGADICKLAVMPKDAGDVIRLLEATRQMRSRHPDRPLLTMAMGALGAVTRVSGAVFGSAATFGKVGAASAPGQMDVADLRSVIDALGRALEP
ncbi:type I 3-dehydroquinate dehydratase [Methylobacterium sp. E-066]|uniref:type I 3-dehydroquinate dehydratase n=1 Tax=Methylobacterium sp. E-066 TaxID=2836584 RepID=UPI001FBA327E|nr:type I 3-dehydroquinate dehydratase [Methylobacterium sp. E-066]MCJ2138478.1 type I 3-dehydroquinate dehydratase [Methylobacterium sp. E-066]